MHQLDSLLNFPSLSVYYIYTIISYYSILYVHSDLIDSYNLNLIERKVRLIHFYIP